MKRFLFVITLAVSALAVSAQTEDSLALMRKGDTYYVDSTKMNKRAFMGYLKSQDAITYQYFRSGYRLSNVGWGLFGGGLVVTFLAVPAGEAITNLYRTPDGKISFFKAIGVYYEAAFLFNVIGAAITVSGITCLGIGYGRMHKAADDYIMRRRKPDAVSLSLKSSSDGIGLVLRF